MRNIGMFLGEQGVNLYELAERLGLSPEELDTMAPVPPELAEKITALYGLPTDYFTADPPPVSVKNARGLGYFLGVTIGASFIMAIPVLFLVIIAIIVVSPVIGDTDAIAPASVKIGEAVALVIVLLEILLAHFVYRHIEKRNGYTGDLKKYRFICYYIPTIITMVFNIPIMARELFPGGFINSGIFSTMYNSVVNLGGGVLSFVLTAYIMKTVFENQEGVKDKLLIRLYSASLAITVLYHGLEAAIYAEYTPALAAAVAMGLLNVTALGLFIADSKKKIKLPSVCYTVLPITLWLLEVIEAFILLNIIGPAMLG